MSGRHQPVNGADSAEAWTPRPWNVLMCDRYDEDFRFMVRVDAAIGRNDAMNQARDIHPEGSPLRAEEVTQ